MKLLNLEEIFSQTDVSHKSAITIRFLRFSQLLSVSSRLFRGKLRYRYDGRDERQTFLHKDRSGINPLGSDGKRRKRRKK